MGQVLHLCVKQGWEIHYISVEPYPMQYHLLVPHILWTPFKRHRSILFWTYFTLLTPVYALFIARRHRANLLLLHGIHYGLCAVLTKCFLHIPYLLYVHSDPEELSRFHAHPFPVRLAERWIGSLTVARAAKIITVSESLRRMILARYEIPESQVQTLYNWVDIKRVPFREARRQLCQEFGFQNEDFLIITTAVFSSRKNIEFLIRGFALAQAVHAVLLIIGDGGDPSLRSRLEGVAREQGVRDKIIFAGWQVDVRRFLCGSDLFVLPSLHEGCPLSLLEALRCGVPSLGSDIPEIREVLGSEDLLFSLKDETELADKIRRATQDRAYYQLLCERTLQAGKLLATDWEASMIGLIKETFVGSES